MMYRGSHAGKRHKILSVPLIEANTGDRKIAHVTLLRIVATAQQLVPVRLNGQKLKLCVPRDKRNEVNGDPDGLEVGLLVTGTPSPPDPQPALLEVKVAKSHLYAEFLLRYGWM